MAAGLLLVVTGLVAALGVEAADNVFADYRDNTVAAYLTMGGVCLGIALLLAIVAAAVLRRPRRNASP